MLSRRPVLPTLSPCPAIIFQWSQNYFYFCSCLSVYGGANLFGSRSVRWLLLLYSPALRLLWYAPRLWAVLFWSANTSAGHHRLAPALLSRPPVWSPLTLTF